MQVVEALDSKLVIRFGKQHRLLLRKHQANLGNNPASHATKSSRSNLMAVQHTVNEMYGEAVARNVTNLGGQF
ncbi:MAG: hypothetical protein WCB11_26025 [Terriglobales bacterium]|jgi:hypothetical protein